MPRVTVGKVSEIPPGGRKIIVPFRGRAGIGVFNVNGSFYALRNICPHNQGPLCTGEVTGVAAIDAPPSVPGNQPRIEREGEVIRCPWHLWSFDIVTGQCLVNPQVRVKTYQITIQGDDIVIEVDDVSDV